MSRWEATSTKQLEEISGLIHDSYFDLDDVEYDAAAGTLSVAFAQSQDWSPLSLDPAWHDAPQTEVLAKTRGYTEERVPFVRGLLVVTQVVSATLDSAAGEAAMLLGIGYEEAVRELTIEGVSGNLVARVKRLHVVAELQPNEIALYVRRRRGRIGESEVPLWGWTPDG